MSSSNEVALQAASKSDASDSQAEANQAEESSPDAVSSDASEDEPATQQAAAMAITASSDGEINGIKYSKNSDGTITITGYEGSDASVAIPATIDGCAVTSIGGEAFEGCTFLAYTGLLSSVKSIGGYAFEGCSSLVSAGTHAANA